jgi:peptidoglycan/xylan/chitin deacetylase (PgdA/CDA1 family)
MPTLMVGEVIPGLYQTDRIVGEVAVTMDDMPKPHFTDMGLRWLDEFGVTATFFIVGRLAERYPDNVRKIVDAGHELGNHTYSHPNLANLTDIEILDELDRTQEAVDRALGYHYPMRQMRPPYGSPWYGSYEDETINRVAKVMSTRNACLTLWNLSTKDTQRDCTRSLMVKGLKQSFDARNGGVLVFHPTRCTKESFRAVMRTALYEEMRFSTTRRFIEQKYGHPLEHLSQWSPALAAEAGTRPTASL